MLERMKNILKNRKADGDKGFSLVELAVVIVVIGILVAIAIPVFLGIQDGANKAQVEAAAANGAAIAAGEIAASPSSSLTAAEVTALNASGGAIGSLSGDDVASVTLSGTDLDSYCVVAVGSKVTSSKGTASNCANDTVPN